MLNRLNALLDLLPMAVVMVSVYLCVWASIKLWRRGWYKLGFWVRYLPILLLLGAAVVLTVGVVR